MKMLIAVTLAVGGGIASYMAPSPATSAPGIDPVVTAAVGNEQKIPADERDYTVANIASNTACLLRRSKTGTVRTSAIQPQSSCDDVWPRLSDAQNWTRSSNGSVILSDASGTKLLRLEPGDGVAYQTFDPPSAQIVLTLAQ